MILVQLLLPFSSTTLISTIFKLYTRFSMQKVRHAPDFLGCSSEWSAFPALVSFFFFFPFTFYSVLPCTDGFVSSTWLAHTTALVPNLAVGTGGLLHGH